MVPFLLYAITGVSTGAQVFRLMMWGVWGRPVAGLEGISLLGSLVLLVAAFVSLSRARRAAWVAFVATLLMWTFYGPVVVVSLRGIARASQLVYFLPALLLIGTTVHAVMAGPLRERLGRAPAWLFPEEASRRVKIAAEVLALGVAGAIVASVFFVGVEKTVTHEMRWTVGEGRNARGEREILLIYTQHPYHYERFYSEKLAGYLESLGRDTVPVTFRVTSDFGTVRDYRVRHVGEWPGKSTGWTGGGSGCGGALPPCAERDRSPPRSPWAE